MSGYLRCQTSDQTCNRFRQEMGQMASRILNFVEGAFDPVPDRVGKLFFRQSADSGSAFSYLGVAVLRSCIDGGKNQTY
jgi:hypothetical protein